MLLSLPGNHSLCSGMACGALVMARGGEHVAWCCQRSALWHQCALPPPQWIEGRNWLNGLQPQQPVDHTERHQGPPLHLHPLLTIPVSIHKGKQPFCCPGTFCLYWVNTELRLTAKGCLELGSRCLYAAFTLGFVPVLM